MTRIVTALLLILTLSAAVRAQADASKPGSQGAAQDEAALRAVVRGVEDAWNAHDGKAFAAGFAADADYVVVNGMHVKGRDAIEQGHTQIFSTIYRESRNTATVKGVRFLRPDVAVAHVEWNLEVSPGGEKARALNTMVLTKDGGKWSIAAFHNTPSCRAEGGPRTDSRGPRSAARAPLGHPGGTGGETARRKKGSRPLQAASLACSH